MTVVSSKEFVKNEDKYFDMALDEQVLVKRGDNMFLIINKKMNIYHDDSVYEEVLEADDELGRAITGEELLTGIYEDLEKFFANK